MGDEGTIMNHTVVGTTRYMSPERLRGKVYTRSSDVWSLGLVLLEIVRGDSPFEDVTSVVSLILFFSSHLCKDVYLACKCIVPILQCFDIIIDRLSLCKHWMNAK